MNRKFNSLARNILAGIVIFQMAFSMAISPIAVFAFEKDGQTRINPEDGQTDTGKEIKDTSDEGGVIETTDTTSEEGSNETRVDGENQTEEGTVILENTGSSESSSSSSFSVSNSRAKGGNENVCDPQINLVQNGGFEDVSVTSGDNWDIYPNGTANLGWTVAWMPGSDQEDVANMELQKTGLWDPYERNQYTELDSDHDGHAGTQNGEASSVKLSQTINTIPGQDYSMSFAFAARPGTDSSENQLQVYVDGFAWGAPYNSDGTGLTQPFWIPLTVNFTADSYTTTIAFADVGNSNSVGTFLDAVKVNCVKTIDNCSTNSAIYARIKLSAQPFGYRNWGTGNMAPKIYVGGNTPADMYDPGEWFLLYDGTNFVNDADIAGYEDVPGLAVQRLNGAVRVVLHGSLEEPVENQLLNRELAQGSLEFSNDQSTRSLINVPTSQVSDPANAMDMNGDSQYHPGGDTMSIVNNLSQFHMLTTVNDDGFYTYYVAPKPCDNGDDDNGGDDDSGKDDYGTIIVHKQSIGGGNETFTFSGPNGTFDVITNSDGFGDTTVSPVVVGTYTITENSKDGWNQTSTTCTDIVVSADATTDCTFVNTKSTVTDGGDDDSGGGDDDSSSGDDDSGGGSGGGGGGGSSGSRSGGSRLSQGEVLGAETGPCVQFTEYHKTGDIGGEIPALQTFLNSYMKAGLAVTGVYDSATTQAVHDFQAYHWGEIIDPWNPPLSANTTGREYKTTRMTMNFLMGCPEQAVYLEDPKMMYEVTEVKDKKVFDASEVASLLEVEHAGVDEFGK